MFFGITVVAYLVGLIAVGFYRKREVRTQEDFIVAGRKLTAPVLVGTLLATWIGSGSIFNGGRLAYENGFASLWSAAGAWVGIALAYFLARKVREGEKLTVPHILAGRYSRSVALAATVATVIAYVTIVSYQFRGGGQLFEIVTGGSIAIGGWGPRETGIVITAVFTIAYTVLSGMFSVAYTDVFNGVVMMAGFALAIPFVLGDVGGVAAFVSSVPDVKWQLFGAMGPAQAAAYFLPTAFLLLGDANMYQRFLSAESPHAARRSVIGWLVGVVLLETMIAAVAFFGSVAEPDLVGDSSSNVLILVAMSHLPVVVGALLIAAIMAAIVSTADSFLLVAATNLSHDLLGRRARSGSAQDTSLGVNRLAIVVLGLAAYLMVSFFPTILKAAYTAYTIYGAAITPALLAVYVWKKASAVGAVMSIAAGTVVTIAWAVAEKVLGQPPFGVEAIFPALVSSVLLLVAGSLGFPDNHSR